MSKKSFLINCFTVLNAEGQSRCLINECLDESKNELLNHSSTMNDDGWMKERKNEFVAFNVNGITKEVKSDCIREFKASVGEVGLKESLANQIFC
jgi:hypothetical protein